MQELFPLDYILYSWIFVFLVMCSISGLKNLGIRFLWLTVYKIKPYSTKPQALVIGFSRYSSIWKLTFGPISRFWCLWILYLSRWLSAWSLSPWFRIIRLMGHKTTLSMSPVPGYPQKWSRGVLALMHPRMSASWAGKKKVTNFTTLTQPNNFIFSQDCHAFTGLSLQGLDFRGCFLLARMDVLAHGCRHVYLVFRAIQTWATCSGGWWPGRTSWRCRAIGPEWSLKIYTFINYLAITYFN